MPSCSVFEAASRATWVGVMPPRPEDIMDEPADLEEHEEPNPIQDEAESDKVWSRYEARRDAALVGGSEWF